MTPKLKLREADKKASLSCILKSFFPGNLRMMMSTHIMDAPNTHATRIHVSTHAAEGLESWGNVTRHTYAAQDRHDPSSLIVGEAHVGFKAYGSRIW